MAFVKFANYPKEKLAEQLRNCYNLGVLNEKVPETILRARMGHVQNVVALGVTERIFSDVGANRSPRRQIKERTEQERLWVAHYDACIAQHREGRKGKHKETNGFDLAFLVSVTEDLEMRNKAEAESKAKLAERNKEHVDVVGKVRPALPKPTPTVQKGNDASKNPKMTAAEYRKKKSLERARASGYA